MEERIIYIKIEKIKDYLTYFCLTVFSILIAISFFSLGYYWK